MTIKHYPAIANFRLNEWPKAQASYTMFFNKHMAIHNMSEVVDFLSDVLYSSRCSLVRYSIFTLVNVSMPKAHVSYGTMPICHNSLYGLSDVVLTFAYTNKVRYTPTLKPKFVLKVGRNAYLWGTRLQHNTDYLTIFLPANVYRSMKIGSLVSDVEFLYYVLGSWSKNFVRHNKYFSTIGNYASEPIAHNIAYSTIYRKTIPDLMHRYSYDKWIYNKEMWERLPTMLNPKSVDDSFLDYFCRYLTEYYTKSQVPSIKQIMDSVYDYLEGAVLDLLELLRGTNSPYISSELSGSTLVFMLSTQEGSLPDFAASLSSDSMNVERFINKLSNVDTVVKDLLNGTFKL
jgi:hypothetical protein